MLQKEDAPEQEAYTRHTSTGEEESLMIRKERSSFARVQSEAPSRSGALSCFGMARTLDDDDASDLLRIQVCMPVFFLFLHSFMKLESMLASFGSSIELLGPA